LFERYFVDDVLCIAFLPLDVYNALDYVFDKTETLVVEDVETLHKVLGLEDHVLDEVVLASVFGRLLLSVPLHSTHGSPDADLVNSAQPGFHGPLADCVTVQFLLSGHQILWTLLEGLAELGGLLPRFDVQHAMHVHCLFAEFAEHFGILRFQCLFFVLDFFINLVVD